MKHLSIEIETITYSYLSQKKLLYVATIITDELLTPGEFIEKG